ncbi:MAG: hypothetical protein ACYTFI_09635 [Planctomycetota bacterium]
MRPRPDLVAVNYRCNLPVFVAMDHHILRGPNSLPRLCQILQVGDIDAREANEPELARVAL